jgi:predicted dithiol-disulfide oxidoreductase (DUF899 family)
MKTPPIVSSQEWEAARQQLLVKEKALTRELGVIALAITMWARTRGKEPRK